MRISARGKENGDLYSTQTGAFAFKAQCNGANQALHENFILTNLPDGCQRVTQAW
jgi:hypothetical protein